MENILQTLSITSQHIHSFIDDLKNQLSSDDNLKFQLFALNKSIKRKHIYFTGIGKNQPICEKTANSLRSLGFVAHNFDAVNAMHGDLGVLDSNSILIAVSKSGNTSELIHTMTYVGANLPEILTFGVSLSGNTRCKFDDVVMHSIKLPEVIELDSWNKVPTTSNLALQIFFDVIVVEAAKIKNLTIEEFVKSHPGGTIGQTFN